MDISADRGGRGPTFTREWAGSRHSAVLGSLTISGCPERVGVARAFVARVLSQLPKVDADSAALMTSELVTNAIQHTRSGTGGTVTVTAVRLPDGVLIEVLDDGSPGAPIVKNDLYAAHGHGLYLVQQLAARWGYLRHPRGGTTVWFHLPAPDPDLDPELAGTSPVMARLSGPGVIRSRCYPARAAARMPAQTRARSSSSVTYGGIA